jgi:hypothetical protein
MKVSDIYPTKYLKATDLQGREHRVAITNVIFENVGDDKKLVAYFTGKQKGLVLNKTNARALAKVFGDDSGGWLNKEVIIHETVVDFRGDAVPTIRVKFPPQVAPSVLAPEPPPQQQWPDKDELNDEVPF